MDVDLFDFDLPPERIALRPASLRDAARMLVLEGAGSGGATRDRLVSDLPAELRRGDLLVFNDTRVIPAQLEGMRGRRGSAQRSTNAKGPGAGAPSSATPSVCAMAIRSRSAPASPRPQRTAPRTAASRSISPVTSRSNCCSIAPGGCRSRRI